MFQVFPSWEPIYTNISTKNISNQRPTRLYLHHFASFCILRTLPISQPSLITRGAIFGGHGRNGRIWLRGQAVQLWFWRSVVTWSRVSKWPSSQCCRWMQWHLHLVVAAQCLWHLPSMGGFCLGNRKSLGLQQRRLWSQSSCPSRVHRSLSIDVHGRGRFCSGHWISGSPLQCPSQNGRQQAWWQRWLLRFPFSSPCHWMDQAKWSPRQCLCQDI